MTENMKESQEIDILGAENSTPAAIQQIYEEAEGKYGPGFAQYCVDIMTRKPAAVKPGVPKNHQIINFLKLKTQLHTLSAICDTDHFHEWAAEDKHSYITLLKTVAEDMSHALQRSLTDLKVSNDHESAQDSNVFEVTLNENGL